MKITKSELKKLIEEEMKHDDTKRSDSTWKSLTVETLAKVESSGDFTLNYQGPKQIILTMHLRDKNDKSKMYDLVVNIDNRTNYNIHEV